MSRPYVLRVPAGKGGSPSPGTPGTIVRPTGAPMFKIPTKSKSTKPSSPEELFRTLGKRSNRVAHLWAHQADLLRLYVEQIDKPNVAFELPTGAGKSLIALLVGEFRRQTRDERVAYLCATTQLARHLHHLAEAEYGIQTVVLTGKQRDYDPGDFNAYNTGQKIAITNYSSLFNTNPKIDNPHCILLDDAHAAENYMAKLWSVEISREDHRPAFDAIVTLFHDVLPESLVFHMVDDAESSTDAGCGLLHPPAMVERSKQLREIISAHAEKTQKGYGWAWSLVDEHLSGCVMLVSPRQILIRPLCPPSMTHAPFANARQRIFISATLGNGGELERGTGVDKIHRLPLPPGWDRRSSGRRLILFPNMSLRADEVDGFLASVAKESGRLLVLTTDLYQVAAIEKRWLGSSGKKVLRASDVESDLTVFTANPDAALLLTNRYDGIDLPDDTCRRMVIAEQPDATNLQERFLTERMGAGAALRERVRTRLTQAMGRCTRNDADHAIVLIVGDDLTKFLTEIDVRKCMHPELQAELDFGIANSADKTADDFLAVMKLFRTPAWDEAEAHIVETREELTRSDDPAAAALRNAVGDELKYVYGAWNGDWKFASNASRKALESLSGGSELKPYQGLWYYLAAHASLQADPGSGEAISLANDLYSRAVGCAPGLAFFLRTATPQVFAHTSVDVVAATAAQFAARRLGKLGHLGKRFEREIATLKADLATTEADAFQRGLDSLGAFLGFEVLSGIAKANAAPDSVWHIDHDLVIGWEAKSDESAGDAVSVSSVRQAVGHFEWIKEKMQLTSFERITVILTSPRSVLDAEAQKHAGDLRFAGIAWVRELGDRVATVLTEVRRKVGHLSEARIAEELATAFLNARLTPKVLAATASPLRSLKTR